MTTTTTTVLNKMTLKAINVLKQEILQAVKKVVKSGKGNESFVRGSVEQQ